MITLRGLPFIGIMGTYGGGGYVAELGSSQLKAKRFLGKVIIKLTLYYISQFKTRNNA